MEDVPVMLAYDENQLCHSSLHFVIHFVGISLDPSFCGPHCTVGIGTHKYRALHQACPQLLRAFADRIIHPEGALDSNVGARGRTAQALAVSLHTLLLKPLFPPLFSYSSLLLLLISASWLP